MPMRHQGIGIGIAGLGLGVLTWAATELGFKPAHWVIVALAVIAGLMVLGGVALEVAAARRPAQDDAAAAFTTRGDGRTVVQGGRIEGYDRVSETRDSGQARFRDVDITRQERERPDR